LRRVTIIAVGHCDAASRRGGYEVLLESGEARRYMTNEFTDTTVNRCIIQGLVDAVGALKYPCAVELVVATTLGFAKARKGKGPNRDLLRALVNGLDEGGHRYEVTEVTDGTGASLRARIRRHRPG